MKAFTLNDIGKLQAFTRNFINRVCDAIGSVLVTVLVFTRNGNDEVCNRVCFLLQVLIEFVFSKVSDLCDK